MEIKIPLRISFIGGGTDFASWTERGKEGHTISCTFDKYARISDNGSFAGIDNFDNLLTAATEWYTQFGYSTYAFPKKLKVACEMPPGSGLGTSSALMVGILKYLFLKDQKYHSNRLQHLQLPEELASAAIKAEREIGKISGGFQDQYISCFPGITEFKYKDNEVKVIPLKHYVTYEELSHKLILIDTGVIRRQSSLMTEQLERNNSGENDEYLQEILNTVPIFIDSLKRRDWHGVGSALNHSWRQKIKLASGINITEVNDIEKIIKTGPGYRGSKLMGAGGGGYILVICDNRDAIFPYLTSKGLRCILPNIVDQAIIEGEIDAKAPAA